jgi:hypothetical protein
VVRLRRESIDRTVTAFQWLANQQLGGFRVDTSCMKLTTRLAAIADIRAKGFDFELHGLSLLVTRRFRQTTEPDRQLADDMISLWSASL